MALHSFHPITRAWFEARFRTPTEPQSRGWPAIAAGRDVLITAPTGSGKTLAAFLWGLDGLLRDALTADLPDETRVLYVSPLRALSHDIHRNLGRPLTELMDRVRREHPEARDVRAAVRTGDTSSTERQRILRRPPHVLVTTPESLYLLLTSPRSRERLRTVRTVIVDEIHALAGSKRGAHLALSLERLEAVAAQRPQRIGLSATVAPLPEVAAFLGGAAAPHPATIVDAGHGRERDLRVEVPDIELGAACTHEDWEIIHDHLAGLIEAHRSTIVFVNTRRLSERLTHHLATRLGPDRVAAHHGSLALPRRRDVETRLAHGHLRAVVATGSLELGLDVGHIDLVCQVGAPGSIATFLQRVGRSGHSLDVTPTGRLFPLTRDELLSSLALVRAAQAGRLDALRLPVAPIDVLAQQLVAMVADRPRKPDDDGATSHALDDLFALVRRSHPYRDLSRERFDAVVTMLGEGTTTSRGRIGALLHLDRTEGQVRARRSAFHVALANGGAIPDSAELPVVLEEGSDRVVVGTVHEEFATESVGGHVFLLGTNAWRIRHIRGGTMVVTDAGDAAPTIPFWRGEAPGRTPELSEEVSRLREAIAARLGPMREGITDPGELPAFASTVGWLQENDLASANAARQAARYVALQVAATGMVPTAEHLLVERLFDEVGGQEIVIHAPLGTGINRAWGLALRRTVEATLDTKIQASAEDDGIVLSLGQGEGLGLDEVVRLVRSAEARSTLVQAVVTSPLFRTRWRWTTSRALVNPRIQGWKPVAPPIQRMRADDLLAAILPDLEEAGASTEVALSDHPLLEEALADCLTEAMDAEAFEAFLRRLEAGAIAVTTLDTREASPFAHERLNAAPYAFLDGGILEERRAREVHTTRTTDLATFRELAALDPAAVELLRAEVWPPIRDLDELHDLLADVLVLPLHEAGDLIDTDGNAHDEDHPVAAAIATRIGAVREMLSELIAAGRAAVHRRTGPDWAVSREREREVVEVVEIVRAWLGLTGPIPAAELAVLLGVPVRELHPALLAVERDGTVIRGRFTQSAREAKVDEHCARHLLERLHRMTRAGLRRRVRPVSPAAYLRFLVRYQHLTADTLLSGRAGLDAIVAQLTGYEAPAGDWETSLLAPRLDRYDPAWLDALTREGDVVWARLRPPLRRIKGDEERPPRRFDARVPISFVRRETLPLLIRELPEESPTHLGTVAASLYALLAEQGSVIPALVPRSVWMLPQYLREAMGELAAAGLVTSDGFAALRALLGTSGAALLADLSRRGGSDLSSGAVGARGRAALRSAGRHRGRAGRGLPDPFEATRWVRLADELELDEAVDVEDHAAAWARILLDRYGVVFADLLPRERHAPGWWALVRVLRRMEDRGEVRGGRFLERVGGEQFAWPWVLDDLRAAADRQDRERVVVAATDPVNLVGWITDDAVVPAQRGTWVVLKDGRCVGVRRTPAGATRA